MKPLRELVLTDCISAEEVTHPVLLVDRCLLNGLKGSRAAGLGLVESSSKAQDPI